MKKWRMKMILPTTDNNNETRYTHKKNREWSKKIEGKNTSETK